MMVSLDDAVIARLDRNGERFEILVEPELAHKFREGEEGVELADILAVEEVFKDAHRGDRATDEILNETFATTEVLKIAAYIIEKGEIQLTTEQRKKMQAEKKKQVINLLARNCINPVTKTPHPPQRLEMALDEIKFNIDPFKSAESQVNEALKALRPVIPIRMEMTTIAVKVDGSHYGKLIGDVRGYGKILKEEWTKDGDWVFVIEIPAGLQVDFFDEINGKTHGEAQSKILNQ